MTGEARALREVLPLVLRDGAWIVGADSEVDNPAVIVYTTEPSPETGHVGWCWWARGRMGDAPTLAAAMRAAEAVFARRATQ